MGARDSAMANTVEWLLRGEERIVVAAHNAHVQRWPCTLADPPATPMGMYLSDSLGDDYRVIGTTSGGGRTLNTAELYTGAMFTDLEQAEPGTLDALMAASADGLFAVDLRRLSPADADTVRAARRQRVHGLSVEIDAMEAYDVFVHVPLVTAAEPDPGAAACSPPEVRAALARTA
ncbi:erythromycin esterase family protein [Streptomyces odonnellii]|uniref:erythromycin esterase family protein n=1 Tax=Streptomyces odonnellii TaxID=1417980 RepID=UPI00099C0E6C|nr:erythromycin esterase family protein [Streptomyces odonnellii]